MLDIIEGVRKNPIPEDQVEGAKSYLLGVKKIASQTLTRRVEEAVLNQVLGLGLDYSPKWEKAVKAVTPTDVQRVAAKYLVLEKGYLGAAGVKAPLEEAWAALIAREGAPSSQK
jgi:zinc protease